MSLKATGNIYPSFPARIIDYLLAFYKASKIQCFMGNIFSDLEIN
jgi:hypothetical protein